MSQTNPHPGKTLEDYIDEENLASLQEVFPAETLNELVQDVIFEVFERLKRIETALADGSLDYPAIARDAHDLKSMSGNFGLIYIQQFAGDMETACAKEQSEEIREAQRNLLSVGKSSLEALIKWRTLYKKQRFSEHLEKNNDL